MNEAEARTLREIIQGTIRETIAEELKPIRVELRKLAGLPTWVEDLTDKTLKLSAAVEDLRPLVESHSDDLRAVARILRVVEPRIERCVVLVEQLIPQMARALDLIDVNREDNAKLRESLTEIEANGQRQSVGP